MKNFLKLVLFFLIVFGFQKSFAQLRGINYQAVAIDVNGKEIAGMDNSGQALSEKTIGVKFTILGGGQNGTNLYQETHVTNTDKFGLFSLIIGDGKTTAVATYTALVDIPWSAANQFLEVELDLNNTGDLKS